MEREVDFVFVLELRGQVRRDDGSQYHPQPGFGGSGHIYANEFAFDAEHDRAAGFEMNVRRVRLNGGGEDRTEGFVEMWSAHEGLVEASNMQQEGFSWGAFPASRL